MPITIDKAIQNLTEGREDAGMIPPEEYTPTIDLATEALKYHLFRRHTPDAVGSPLLPGETLEASRGSPA